MKEDQIYDVAVVGAGPSGMMASGRAGELGAKVILIEKNDQPGIKILISGKGRCNITNAEFNLREFVKSYGKNGSFLFHALSVFGPQSVIDFFAKRGLRTKIERGKRVFPASDNAGDVIKALTSYLRENKVSIVYNSKIAGIDFKDGKISRLLLEKTDPSESRQGIRAKNYIFCTGGKSYPQTGSTGDGYKWAKKLGHTIKDPVPALVPIRIREDWVKELQGLSLKNVELSILQNKKKVRSEFGECLFAHFGITGPIVLTISKEVGELAEKGAIKLSLDLKPALDFATLDKRIQSDFSKSQNKAFKNSLDDLLPRKLIPVIVRLSKINPEKKTNSVTREERLSLVKLFKNMEMTPVGLLGFNMAIVTSGGVSLKEIDDKTTKSKIIDNLFFAGEIIDIDGFTGGFNLQNCWSTGYLAGESAARRKTN